jgi:hypothetical protein
MRRARYSANLRAAGQMFLGASVFIDARALLAFLPAVGSAIWKLSVIDLSVLVGKRGSCVQRISVVFGISECWWDHLVAGAAKKVRSKATRYARGQF